MTDKELKQFYKRQCILSIMEAKQGKPPRIVGVSYQNDETGEYLVSRNGKAESITPEEFEKLSADGRMIFGHKVVSDEQA